MSSPRLAVLLLVGFGLCRTLIAVGADGPDTIPAAEVLRKAIDARGGQAALKEIHSLRATGKVLFHTRSGPWWDAPAITNTWPLALDAMRPDRFRCAVDLRTTQGASSAFVPPRYYDHGFDGRIAWEAAPGRPPHALPGILQEERAEQGQFFAWCAEPTNYLSATNLGATQFKGQRCYEVRLVRSSGNPETHYYNMANWLLVGVVRSSAFGPSLERFAFSDYREFGGFKFPMRTEYEAEDERDWGQLRAIEALDTILVNAVDESCFRMPAGSPRLETDQDGPRTQIAAAEVKAMLRDWVEDDKLAQGVVVKLLNEHDGWTAEHGTEEGRLLGRRRKINGDTLFGIASISKVFTRLLLLDMVQRGEMKLDDPAQQYLPASVRLPERNGKAITLLHLATHTSGLPRYFPGTEQEVYAQLSECRPERDPGEGYEYSNTGMGLLGKAIEHRAGRPYRELIAERICRPLGMNHTTVMGFDFPGIDGIKSCANDLAKFSAACLGLRPAPPVLSALMQHLYATHGGAGGNGRMYLLVDPLRRRALVTLAVARDGNYGLVQATLNRLMRNESPKPLRAIHPDWRLYDEYVGQYLSEDNSAWMVRRQEARLLVQPLRGPACEVFPLSADHFLNQMTGLEAAFVSGTTGGPPKLVLHQTSTHWRWQGNRVSAQAGRRGVAATLAPTVAEDCAGQYQAPGGKSIVIRFDGPRFTAQTQDANSPDVDVEYLQPESESCFASVTGPAAFSFLRDSGGKVTGLVRHIYGSNTRYAKCGPAPLGIGADAERFVGSWQVVLEMPNQVQLLGLINLSKKAGIYQATADVGDVRRQPLDTVVFLNRASLFLGCSSDDGRDTFQGTLNSTATEISGTWNAKGKRLPVILKRSR